MNNRRVWIGVVAGVLAALVLMGVAVGAYQAGQRHDVVTQVVGDGGADVVRVVGGPGWGYGPGPGFFLFPLFGIVVLVLLLRGRGGPGGWNRGCGPDGGYGGYGGREAAMQDWHRRAHGNAAGSSVPAGSDPTGVTGEA